MTLIRYDAGFIKLTQDELRITESKTRKTMAMHRALLPQVDVDRLYLLRNNGGSDMSSVEDCVEMRTESEEVCREQQWKPTKCYGRRGGGRRGDTKIEVLEAGNINFMEKSLHSPFMRKSFEVESQKNLEPVKNKNPEEENWGNDHGVKEQVLGTNNI